MSDTTDTVDNVVHIRFKRTKEDLPTAPITKGKEKSRRFCIDHFFVYDLDERVVECERCDRKFDAFEVLDHLGRRWAAYAYNHRNVRGEIADLHKERDKLQKQVTNLKAQRRRLVPNVRQEIERMRGERWRHEREGNLEIRTAIMRSIRTRIESVLHTLKTFGDEAPAPADAATTATKKGPTT